VNSSLSLITQFTRRIPLPLPFTSKKSSTHILFYKDSDLLDSYSVEDINAILRRTDIEKAHSSVAHYLPRLVSYFLLRHASSALSPLSPPPQEWILNWSVKGAPSITTPQSNKSPAFISLSRSSGYGVIAISTQNPIGVDLQTVLPVSTTDFNYLTQQYLSPPEREQVNSLSNIERPNEFFKLWVQKEAYSKLIGTGIINAPLNSWDFTSLPYAKYSIPVKISSNQTIAIAMK